MDENIQKGISLIRNLSLEIQSKAELQCGYPVYTYNPNNSAIAKWLPYVLNNLGDPFDGTRYSCNTMEAEQCLVKYFGKIHNMSNPWGYSTTGGTEGNICGIHYGLEKFSDAIIYASDQSHYSIRKAAKICRADFCEIKSLHDGSIDTTDLAANIKKNKERSVIICINYGTIMTGAIDSIEGCVEIAKTYAKHFYIHVDAALFGLMMPFIDGAPLINVDENNVDSLSVSGHKMLGTPMPCGMFLSKQRKGVCDHIQYIKSNDSTITGSRSGLSVIAMLEELNILNKSNGSVVKQLVDNAKILMNSLRERDIDAWRANEYSNIIVFEKPSDFICDKYQLATCNNIAHVIFMPHMLLNSNRLINQLTEDISNETILS